MAFPGRQADEGATDAEPGGVINSSFQGGSKLFETYVWFV